MENNKCPKCGADLIHNEGISKAGKPYNGNFCRNKECGHIEWLKAESVKQDDWDTDKRIKSLADRVSALERIVQNLIGEPDGNQNNN